MSNSWYPAWKALWLDLSLLHPYLPQRYALAYDVGEETRAPDGTGCLVFETREQAVAFAAPYLDRGCWEVAVVPVACADPVPLPPYCASTQPQRPTAERIRECWKGELQPSEVAALWPSGTRAYRRVIRLA